MSTDHRPSVDQLLTDTSVKYRPTIDQVSAKCRRNVGEVSVNEKLYRPRHIWNDYRPCLDRVLTHCRPTIDRLLTAISTDCRTSVDRLSTECQPSIDRLSTECRPTIDQVSTDYWPSVDCYIDRYIDRYLGDITHSKQDPRTAGIKVTWLITNSFFGVYVVVFVLLSMF